MTFTFLDSMLAVAGMLIFAVPGFLFIKTKLLDETSIPNFAKLLLYVCQPCLSLYSFIQATKANINPVNVGIVFLLALVMQCLIIFLVWLALRKRFDDVNYRVTCVAGAFGNVGFLGVPLLEKLLPDSPGIVAYSAAFIVALNLLAWTLGCFVLTKDKKYFSAKKLFLNPPMLTLIVALPLFLTGTQLPAGAVDIEGIVTTLGKMTTPLCMIILGMRLATVSPKDLFCDWKVYLATAIKLIVLPLITFTVMLALPLSDEIKVATFILSCCPSATVVLNLSEMFGSGQKVSANIILLSTICCIVTIPLMLLLV